MKNRLNYRCRLQAQKLFNQQNLKKQFRVLRAYEKLKGL